MAKFKLKDFAKDISVAIKDAQSSPLKQFVGLEHYDSGEPVITRFTDTSLISSSVKEFKENDILIARRNVYLRRAGIAFFSGLTSGDSIILRIYDDCEEKTGIPKEDAIKILPFILNSNDFWNYANKHADGMNSKRISKDMLYDYEFDLPSLSEQKILADKLWAAYRLKESYKKLLAATDEMVKSQFIEMFKEAPRIELGKMASFINGSAFKPEEWSSDGLPIVRIQNLTQDDSPYNYYDGDTTKKIVIDNGDMLVSWSATLGVFLWSKGKALLNQHIFKVSFDKLDVNKDFFVYAVKLALDKMSEVAHGSTMRHVVKKDFNETIVANPSINDQESFALIAKQADKSKFELRKSIDAIDAVIKSLINDIK